MINNDSELSRMCPKCIEAAVKEEPEGICDKCWEMITSANNQGHLVKSIKLNNDLFQSFQKTLEECKALIEKLTKKI